MFFISGDLFIGFRRFLRDGGGLGEESEDDEEDEDDDEVHLLLIPPIFLVLIFCDFVFLDLSAIFLNLFVSSSSVDEAEEEDLRLVYSFLLVDLEPLGGVLDLLLLDVLELELDRLLFR